MQIAQQCPCFGVGLNLLVFIQSQSHRHAYYNPLTPKICLLILASNCYTFPCNLVARIWCQIKWNGYCGGEVTCESLLGVKGLRLALHATLLVNPYRKKSICKVCNASQLTMIIFFSSYFITAPSVFRPGQPFKLRVWLKDTVTDPVNITCGILDLKLKTVIASNSDTFANGQFSIYTCTSVYS